MIYIRIIFNVSYPFFNRALKFDRIALHEDSAQQVQTPSTLSMGPLYIGCIAFYISLNPSRNALLRWPSRSFVVIDSIIVITIKVMPPGYTQPAEFRIAWTPLSSYSILSAWGSRSTCRVYTTASCSDLCENGWIKRDHAQADQKWHAICSYTAFRTWVTTPWCWTLLWIAWRLQNGQLLFI